MSQKIDPQSDFTKSVISVIDNFTDLAGKLVSLPFNIARENYASSVRAGLLPNSLIASARFERSLSAFEVASLRCVTARNGV